LQQQALLQALGFSNEALEHHTDTSSMANVSAAAAELTDLALDSCRLM
jgi:hypothetical protein